MGVWIETKEKALRDYYKWVTPCVGVWIETSLGLIVIVDSISHTLRGCVD